MPTPINGLSRRMLEIHNFADERRRNGQPMTLRGALRAWAIANKLASGADLETLTEQLYYDAGVDPRTVTVENLLTSDTFKEFRWITVEVVLDGIQKGLLVNDIASDFVNSTQNARLNGALVPIFPRVTKAKVKKSSEGADPYRSTISFTEKHVRTHAWKHAFEITYQALRAMTLEALQEHMRIATNNLVAIRNRYALDVLINGEKPTDAAGVIVDESAAEIGVENTTNKFTYLDLTRAWVRMSMLGLNPTSLLGTEAQVLTISQWDEFSKRYAGSTDANLMLKGIRLPRSVEFYVVADSDLLNADAPLLVDRSACLGKLVDQAPMVEGDKLIMQQVQQIVYSEQFGLYTRSPFGRVNFDAASTFAAKGWPEWFATNVYN